MTNVPCSKHPGRQGSFAVVLHTLQSDEKAWRDTFRHGEPLEALCGECRMKLIHWLMKAGE